MELRRRMAAAEAGRQEASSREESTKATAALPWLIATFC